MFNLFKKQLIYFFTLTKPALCLKADVYSATQSKVPDTFRFFIHDSKDIFIQTFNNKCI